MVAAGAYLVMLGAVAVGGISLLLFAYFVCFGSPFPIRIANSHTVLGVNYLGRPAIRIVAEHTNPYISKSPGLLHFYAAVGTVPAVQLLVRQCIDLMVGINSS